MTKRDLERSVKKSLKQKSQEDIKRYPKVNIHPVGDESTQKKAQKGK